MLSESEIKDCKAHLELAIGFLSTAVVKVESSEFEIRNALSRSYYAVFHASRAWLLTHAVSLDKSRRHGPLRKLVGLNRGEPFASRLHEFYVLRENADYEPVMRIVQDGELSKLRAVVETKVQQAQVECEWYVADAKQRLSQA